jgi:hypothetical protein
MNPAARWHLGQRYRAQLRPDRDALDNLGGALHTLLRANPQEDPFFLGHGLELLRKRLGGDIAYLVTIEGQNLESRWWSPVSPVPPKPIPSFCRVLLDNPHRTLVLRDSRRVRFLEHDEELATSGIRAAVGSVLWGEDQIRGLVFVHYANSHGFTRAELALLDAVAGFLGRILEVETLKSSLRNLETALEITRAVVEDSTIQDPVTDLPNLRYLDIWLKSNLASVQRRQSSMTVAELQMPAHNREAGIRVREMAEGVRGGDLVVSEGQGRFLILIQRTSRKTGHTFLQRLHEKLGAVPMGATLWIPGVDDPSFHSVRRRLDLALGQSRKQNAGLVWNLQD